MRLFNQLSRRVTVPLLRYAKKTSTIGAAAGDRGLPLFDVFLLDGDAAFEFDHDAFVSDLYPIYQHFHRGAVDRCECIALHRLLDEGVEPCPDLRVSDGGILYRCKETQKVHQRFGAVFAVENKRMGLRAADRPLRSPVLLDFARFLPKMQKKTPFAVVDKRRFFYGGDIGT